MAKCQTTGVRTWPPWGGRAGALVADGALAIYGRSVEYRSPDGQRRFGPTAAGSSVLPRCRRTASCSSPGGSKRTPGLTFYLHLQTATGRLPQLAQLVVAASTDRSDVSRQRQLAVDDDAEVTSCVLDCYARRQNAHVCDVQLGELLIWTQPHNLGFCRVQSKPTGS